MNRVILVGIDGATPQLLFKWMDEGFLPTFSQFRQQGSWGKLRSTIPPFSAPAWTSIVTGCNPGKHGIYGFESTGTLTPHLINSRYRKVPAIWNYLTEVGLKNIIINVPGSYPPESINGFMITGLLTPSADSQFTYPANLKQRLIPKDLGQYDLEHFWLEDFSRARMKQQNPEALISLINRQMTQRATVAINLMQSSPWDFSMMVFRGTDTAQHFLFDRPDLLQNCYTHVDHLLNSILEAFPNDTYVIVSDHGFQQIKHVLYPDNVLYNHGYLTPTWNPLQNTSSLILAIVYNLFTRVLKHLPASFVRNSSHLRTLLFSTSTKDTLIDFSQTKAFSTADGRGIQICLKSRYPQGIVNDAEYTKICDELKTIFLSLLHPISGKPLVTNVFLAEEIYGAAAEGPPDLVFSLDEGITASEWIRFPQTLHDLLKNHMEKLPLQYPCDPIGRSGDHAEYGIFFAKGPKIKPNTNINNMTVEDVLPLLFQLMHLPIPDIVTGSIPTTIVKDEKISKKIKWDTTHKSKLGLSPQELRKISELKQRNKIN